MARNEILSSYLPLGNALLLEAGVLLGQIPQCSNGEPVAESDVLLLRHAYTLSP